MLFFSLVLNAVDSLNGQFIVILAVQHFLVNVDGISIFPHLFQNTAFVKQGVNVVGIQFV